MITCPLEITLFHQPALPYPANMRLLGVVTFDYLCFIPDWILGVSGLELPPLIIPVIGTMQENGTLVLEAEVCPNVEMCATLEMEGAGADENTDGNMDAYEGEFSLAVSIPELVSISLVGGFDVSAVD